MSVLTKSYEICAVWQKENCSLSRRWQTIGNKRIERKTKYETAEKLLVDIFYKHMNLECDHFLIHDTGRKLYTSGDLMKTNNLADFHIYNFLHWLKNCSNHHAFETCSKPQRRDSLNPSSCLFWHLKVSPASSGELFYFSLPAEAGRLSSDWSCEPSLSYIPILTVYNEFTACSVYSHANRQN